MDDPGRRYRSGLTFNSRFGEVPFPDQIRQALQKLAKLIVDTVKVEKPFRKDSNGNNATKQNEPHQRPPLLHVVDHPKLIDELWSACKNWAKGRLGVLEFGSVGTSSSIVSCSLSCSIFDRGRQKETERR